MRKIETWVVQTIAIIGVLAGLDIWSDQRQAARLDRIENRLDSIEARQIEQGERLTAVEAGLDTLRAVVAETRTQVAEIEAALAATNERLAATNERLARIEGVFAGVLRWRFGPDAAAPETGAESGAATPD